MLNFVTWFKIAWHVKQNCCTSIFLLHRHNATVKPVACCSPTLSGINSEGYWQRTWSNSEWIGGEDCRLRDPGGRWKSGPAISGVSRTCLYLQSSHVYMCFFPVHYMLLYRYGCFHQRNLSLPTSPRVWGSLDQPLPWWKQPTVQAIGKHLIKVAPWDLSII